VPAHLVAGMNYPLFKFLDDADLHERIERLQRKVEELKQSTTLIGQRMAEAGGDQKPYGHSRLDRCRSGPELNPQFS
jgi:hypothetical protein